MHGLVNDRPHCVWVLRMLSGVLGRKPSHKVPFQDELRQSEKEPFGQESVRVFIDDMQASKSSVALEICHVSMDGLESSSCMHGKECGKMSSPQAHQISSTEVRHKRSCASGIESQRFQNIVPKYTLLYSVVRRCFIGADIPMQGPRHCMRRVKFPFHWELAEFVHILPQ